MLNNHEKRLLIEIIERTHGAGRTMEEALAAVRNELALYPVPTPVRDAVAYAWDEFGRRKKQREQQAIEAERAASKEARGVALYDALIALGWTPPNA